VKEDEVISGFKGFDKDFKCRGFQFEVGKEYKEDDAIICKKGFHFCENPLHIFGYYPPTSRFAEVEGSGKTATHKDDSKVSCTKIKISAEIGLKGIIEAGMKLVFSRVKWGEKDKPQTHGDSSAAQTHGDSSAAQTHGDYSAAQTHGDSSAAQTHGYSSAAQTHGYYSAAQTHGDSSAAQTHGDYSAAQTHGYSSAAQTHGDSSAAQTHGNSSAAQTHGNESIAVSTGIKGRAAGIMGNWIVVAEWVQDADCGWHIIEVKSVKVDGKKIKADTFYQLKNGKFVEVE